MNSIGKSRLCRRPITTDGRTEDSHRLGRQDRGRRHAHGPRRREHSAQDPAGRDRRAGEGPAVRDQVAGEPRGQGVWQGRSRGEMSATTSSARSAMPRRRATSVDAGWASTTALCDLANSAGTNGARRGCDWRAAAPVALHCLFQPGDLCLDCLSLLDDAEDLSLVAFQAVSECCVLERRAERYFVQRIFALRFGPLFAKPRDRGLVALAVSEAILPNDIFRVESRASGSSFNLAMPCVLPAVNLFISSITPLRDFRKNR